MLPHAPRGPRPTLEDGEKLRRVVRYGKDAIEFKRAQSVHASYQGSTPPRISVMALASEGYVRGVIRALNEPGMNLLMPMWGVGRPDFHRRASQLLAAPQEARLSRRVRRSGSSTGPPGEMCRFAKFS
jgi:hypothetical protein